MNSITVKVLGIVLSIFVLIMVGSQVYVMIEDNHDVEEAVLYTVNENISFKGMFVRNETTINTDSTGEINYLYSDGNKVSKGDTVARTFDDVNQVYYRNRIAYLRKKAAYLRRAQSPGTTDYVQAETLKNQIDEKYLAMSNYILKGDYVSAEETNYDMLYMMNIYDIITDKETNYKKTIISYTTEINELKTKITEPNSTITTPDDGYFVSNVDGYETLINCDNIENMSATEIEKIFDKSDVSAPKNAIGKVLDGYSWKFVGFIKPTNKFIENSSLSIRFDVSNKVYSVNVELIKKVDNDKSMIILSCEDLDSTVLQNRFSQAELIFDEYSGVKVPRSAIRFQGEQKGVYVMLGQSIIFKKIDVIYEGDDYVLSNNTSNDNFLLLYDQILLEGVSEQDATTATTTKTTTS